MALLRPLDASPDEVRDALAPLRSRFSVAVFAPENPFAVGAIIRVAHNFLAQEVVIVGTEPHYEKASMGMEKYERIARVPDADAFFAHVSGKPVYAFEKDAARRSLYAVKGFPDDVVLLFGSERRGLPAEVLARVDDVVGIPIYGVNHSLPLAVAAGIAMNEWARQRYAAGATL